MKRKGAALICAGSIGDSFLARLPVFLEQLAIVKAANRRLAVRMANTLRAGRGVDDYIELKGSKTIWIAVPETALDGVVVDLARSVNLTGPMIVVCDTLRDSNSLLPLTEAAARVATVHVMPESSERVFAAEGHPAVLAELGRLMTADRRKLIELRPGMKALFLSGLHLSTHLLLPLIGAAADSFRAAGLSRSEATLAVQALMTAAMRGYLRGGEKALNRPAAESMQAAIERSMKTIRHTDPKLAMIFDPGTNRFLKFFDAK